MWDLRTFQPLHAYYSPSPAEWCDISQRGMLAVGYGRRIQVRMEGSNSPLSRVCMIRGAAGCKAGRRPMLGWCRGSGTCAAPRIPLFLSQVWKDALTSKQQSPYMTHRLAGGTLRNFRFVPYEVRGRVGRQALAVSRAQQGESQVDSAAELCSDTELCSLQHPAVPCASSLHKPAIC